MGEGGVGSRRALTKFCASRFRELNFRRNTQAAEIAERMTHPAVLERGIHHALPQRINRRPLRLLVLLAIPTRSRRYTSRYRRRARSPVLAFHTWRQRSGSSGGQTPARRASPQRSFAGLRAGA